MYKLQQTSLQHCSSKNKDILGYDYCEWLIYSSSMDIKMLLCVHVHVICCITTGLLKVAFWDIWAKWCGNRSCYTETIQPPVIFPIWSIV